MKGSLGCCIVISVVCYATMMVGTKRGAFAVAPETLHLDVFVGDADSWGVTSALIYGIHLENMGGGPEITGRSGQRVAGSGKTAPVPPVAVNRPGRISVARQYSPQYAIQNRNAIRRARFHLGMLGWGWIGSVWGCGIVWSCAFI